ncbi:hypothetical protein L596_001799 [Steinernema carpocapsae]|uniref:Uncharacterized protein n=1 Tax=Steinernema carpocapsae TaxID=34508 RepID=A0A4U8UNB7_STECR|nr:hypothetical protein L596_001799 [Steinernema carpocapsae]
MYELQYALGTFSGHRNVSTVVVYGQYRKTCKMNCQVLLLRDQHHQLVNVPEVDNSCKWAGAALISNVHDMLDMRSSTDKNAYYSDKRSQPKPYLSAATFQELWRQKQQLTTRLYPGSYGLEWTQKIPTEEYGRINVLTTESLRPSSRYFVLPSVETYKQDREWARRNMCRYFLESPRLLGVCLVCKN